MCYIRYIHILVAYMLVNPILVDCKSSPSGFNQTTYQPEKMPSKVSCGKSNDYKPKECCLPDQEAFVTRYLDNQNFKTYEYAFDIFHGQYVYNDEMDGIEALENKTGLYKVLKNGTCTLDTSKKFTLSKNETKCKYSETYKFVFESCYLYGDVVVEGWRSQTDSSLILLRRDKDNGNCYRAVEARVYSKKTYYTKYDEVKVFKKSDYFNRKFRNCQSI